MKEIAGKRQPTIAELISRVEQLTAELGHARRDLRQQEISWQQALKSEQKAAEGELNRWKSACRAERLRALEAEARVKELKAGK
jgi:hypothetical protein